ncbi:hypothetical protein [Sphingobacterium sp.]|uniref:hypothetical protein n=1 Tax=Sphingobacterium sp. TaxID=341027 RepID=UPI0028963675|nr:hypothetical protein [Sphingobacterium sp.]
MGKPTKRGIAQFNAFKAKGWNWQQWQDNAPDAVEAMEELDPAMFNNLYSAEFGVDLGVTNRSNQGAPVVAIKGKTQYQANINKGWTWDEWQENAPEAIQYMEQHEPNVFSALYEIEFGVTLPNRPQTNSYRKTLDTGSRAQYEANANKGWTWAQWQENAPQAVEYMEQNNPDLFKSLYKAEFGVTLDIGSQQRNTPLSGTGLENENLGLMEAAIEASKSGKGIAGMHRAVFGSQKINTPKIPSKKHERGGNGMHEAFFGVR